MSSTVFRRRAAAATTAFLFGLGLFTAQASPASASTDPGVNATPFNEGGEYWDTDGCTDVMDSGYYTTQVQLGEQPLAMYVPRVGYFNFAHACKHHDGCYKFRWSDRATCDQWFLNDMKASCDVLHSNEACYAVAQLYYRGVRVFGEIPWSLHNTRVSMGEFAGDLQDLSNYS
ncbi:phospholipase A2 [Streptomyces longwoodensis]|uniref:phospholipase A2 n=1 Tax=Streptomyces longwoodensis TaxID=68231 RepID=UPI00380801AD